MYFRFTLFYGGPEVITADTRQFYSREITQKFLGATCIHDHSVYAVTCVWEFKHFSRSCLYVLKK